MITMVVRIVISNQLVFSPTSFHDKQQGNELIILICNTVLKPWQLININFLIAVVSLAFGTNNWFWQTVVIFF